MRRLILVRHGETELNAAGVYYGSTDCLLTSHGIEQAQQVREALRDASFDAVISSPLNRAVHTAEVICAGTHNAVHTDSRLQELAFGEWEGLHYTQVREQYPQEWKQWCDDWMHTCPPGGESCAQMYARVEQWLQEAQQKYAGQTVLVVSHQGCLRVIASVLLGLGPRGYWSFAFDQGAYSLLELDGDCCVIRKVNG